MVKKTLAHQGVTPFLFVSGILAEDLAFLVLSIFGFLSFSLITWCLTVSCNCDCRQCQLPVKASYLACGHRNRDSHSQWGGEMKEKPSSRKP